MNRPDKFSHLKDVLRCGYCAQYYKLTDKSCMVFHHIGTCCHYGDDIIPNEVINGFDTLQQQEPTNLYTEEEVLKMIDEAFWDGVDTDKEDYGGEYFDPKDYLPKSF